MAVIPANLIYNNFSNLQNTFDRAKMALIPNGGKLPYTKQMGVSYLIQRVRATNGGKLPYTKSAGNGEHWRALAEGGSINRLQM